MKRMFAWSLLMVSVGLSASACQSSDPKEARCKELFAKAATAAQAAGKSGHADSKPEAKLSFLAKCKELSDEAVACLDVGRAKDEKCKGVRQQHKIAVPFGLE